MRLVAPAAAVLVAAVAATGCGDGGKAGGGGKVAWVETPVVYKPKGLPADRVVLAKVRNAGSKPIRLVAAKLKVLDADGHRVQSAGRYIAGYGHGIYGAFQKPDPLPPQELTRLGYEVELAPGKTAPLSIAWRLRRGVEPPMRLDYGGGTLALPTATRPGD